MLHQEPLRHPQASINAFLNTDSELSPESRLTAALKEIGTPVRYARNSEIYGEDEPAQNVYRVVSGAVRTYKLLSDGRRQIGDFHIDGEIFGLEAGEACQFTAEAIADSVILVAKRNALVTLTSGNAELARELWTHTAGELQRAQDHLLLLGRKRAQERVATFLLDMAGRRDSDIIVDLPMSRQDIADYLGLTIETVSRTLTRLEGDETIEIPTSRRVVLRNRGALGRLNT